ncbi:hypothetical protein PPYR_08246 [Photinus pyralis]|uniref:Hemolymph juvenile hormone binding protein n=1 Tax=Photinus pyralis TaxID=7054 RepID=A0A1Y1MXT2_PHOPY|nr:uncharacterized protein LOC116171415 [Photinus pyralis]XP_031351749.1 uncharacterized protein LOC116177031 [Photinus pyralis]KAB0794285.1 hypothetical protein PPYR_11124 [Photinus pyralis]KAB0797252.1 hypothetical protein PPYR_08246 [Photinus pyralis]
MYFEFGLVSLLVVVSARAQIPDYIHVCKRSDPQVADCIKESVEFLRPRLRKGIAELDVPGLEPLKVEDVDLGRGSPTFKALLKNIDVYGASDFQLVKLKTNIPNLTFRIQVIIPLLRLTGDFDINARILVVPFKGQGKFYANATNCLGTAVLKAESKQANGENTFQFTSLEVQLQIGDYNILLETPTPNDVTLIKAANDILNQNRKDFLGIVTPLIERRVSSILLSIANKITKKFKYDEVFPA